MRDFVILFMDWFENLLNWWVNLFLYDDVFVVYFLVGMIIVYDYLYLYLNSY